MNTQNNTVTVNSNIIAAPNLAAAITDGLTSINSGSNTTMVYTVTVSNIGTIGSTGVVATVNVPANTTVVANSISDSGAVQSGANGQQIVWPSFALNGGGASVMRQFTLKLNDPLPAGTSSTLTTSVTVDDDHSNGADSDPTNNMACDVDCINGIASTNFDLSIQITDGLDTINPGETMVYTLSVANVGNIVANNVLVKATIPANTTVVAGSISNGGSVQGSFVVWPLFTLAQQGSDTRQFTLQLSSTLPNPPPVNLSVTGTISGDAGEQNLANNSATDCDTIVIPPSMVNLAISQSNGLTDCAPLTQTVCYTLTICNLSNTTTTGILVTDTIPLGTDFVSASDGGTYNSATGMITWPLFTLSGGQSTTRSFTVRVHNPPNVGTSIVNTATVTDDGTHGPDKCMCNNTTTLTNPVCGQPELSIFKSLPTDCVTLGSTVTYSIVAATNNDVAVTGVVITDTIPANTTFVSASDGGTFANGVVTYPAFALGGQSVAHRTVTVTIAATVPVNGVTSIVNVVNAIDDGTHGTDALPSNNTFTLTTPICAPNPPDLAITKSVTVPCATLGANLIYTLTASTLNANAATGVVVTDAIPANTTYVSSSNGGTFANGVVTFPAFALSGNSTAIRTVTVAVAASLPDGVTSLSNICYVTDDHSNGADSNPSNNTFTLTTPICGQFPPDLAITKSVSVPCATLGANLIYTLVASTQNANPATGVVVTDTIPANTTYVSSSNGGTFANGVVTFPAFALNGNATAIRTVTVAVAASVPAGVTSLSNVCSVTDDHSNGADSNPSNNTFTLATPICVQPDLSITALDPAPCILPGSNLTYTLAAATNAAAVSNVTITDKIPTNSTYVSSSNGGTFANGVVTFPLFNLDANTTAIRTVTVAIPTNIASGTVFTNLSTVTDDGTHGSDSNTVNNVFTQITPVCLPNPPDLAITKSVNVPCATLGANLIYTLSASTQNANAATGVVITDTLPANTTFVSASNGGTFANGVVTFPSFALNGNSTAIRTVTVAVAASVPAGVTSLSNVASITDDGLHGPDSNPSNNTFTLSTPICTTSNPPDLAITKSVSVPCATLGANLVYTLTASTLNAVSATGIIVTDTLPANTTYVTSSNGGTFANGVVSFPAFALSGNSTATRTITVAVAATVPAGVTNLTNVATITDDGTHGTDTNTSNNSFTLSTPICTPQNPPDLAITKSVPVPCATLGTNLTYTLVATSQNANAATGVVVTDTIPANTTFVSASNGGTFANGVVTFPSFAMNGNSTAIRTVTVAVAASVPAGVTSLINVCSVTDYHSNGPDVNPNDNTYSLTTPICTQNAPDLAIT